MSIRTEIMKHLGEFGIDGCHVRRSNIVAFSTQKWLEDDAMEPRPTMFFFYNPTRAKKDQWAARGWHQVTGVHGCPCFKPSERWVFISDPGEVYVIGQGDDNDETSIEKAAIKHFSAVKCVANGYAYAVGIGRNVYKRLRANNWEQLNSKNMMESATADISNCGFSDIDGFSETEIYACGGLGDLWQYNGKTWRQIDTPTNVNLEKICCASDGNVYITTNANILLVGRNNAWEAVEQNTGDTVLEEMVCFDNKVLVSSEDKIFEIENNLLVESGLSLPPMDSYAHLAAGDGILVVAGVQSAYLFDGMNWKEIFNFS